MVNADAFFPKVEACAWDAYTSRLLVALSFVEIKRGMSVSFSSNSVFSLRTCTLIL